MTKNTVKYFKKINMIKNFYNFVMYTENDRGLVCHPLFRQKPVGTHFFRRKYLALVRAYDSLPECQCD
jgi:hypothetical protein